MILKFQKVNEDKLSVILKISEEMSLAKSKHKNITQI